MKVAAVHLALLLLLGSVALEAARLGTVPFSPALKTFGTSVSQGVHVLFMLYGFYPRTRSTYAR